MSQQTDRLDQIIATYSDREGALIPLLQEAQDELGFLSRETMERVAAAQGLPPAEVYGVATFYTQFRFTPMGKYVIRVCHGTACHVGGANVLDELIKSRLKVGPKETTADGLFTILPVACLGCCSLAPVVMVDDKTYGKLTNEKFNKIIDQYIEAHEKGESL